MRQRLLEKTLKKYLDDSIRQNINKKLEELKRNIKDRWPMDYQWDKKTEVLTVKISKLELVATFQKEKVMVEVDVPFYLLPTVELFRKKIVEILEEEIFKLIA